MTPAPTLPESSEMDAVFQQSQVIAADNDQPLTTVHWLLCLFTVRSNASLFLQQNDVTVEALLGALSDQPSEDPQTLERVRRRALEVARVHQADLLGTLHLLVALCSFVDCAAYRLLTTLRIDMAGIRNAVLAFLQSPRHAEAVADQAPQLTPPSSDATRYPSDAGRAQPRAVPVKPGSSRLAERAFNAQPGRRGTAEQQLDPNLRGGTRRPEPRDAHPGPDARRAARTTATPPAGLNLSALPPSVARLRAQRSEPNRSDDAGSDAPALIPIDPTRYQLSSRAYPILSRLGRNLTIEAIEGRIDAAVGRDTEIQQLIDILNKRRANNPLLLGEPGVGKTAIVEGLAHTLVQHARRGLRSGLEDRIVVELEASALLSGTSLRGAFAERMTQLKQEVARANGQVIVFLDELHHWVGAGTSSDSGSDAAGDLKTALARGEFPCIGATTWEEYRKFVETDAAFTRRFEAIRVSEPGVDAAITVLRGVSDHYATHHDVRITDDAIEAAVRLSHRYLPDRRLPDKAISALDLAGSRARREDERVVTRRLIATVIAEQAGIDPDRLLLADRERFLRLPELLRSHIVSHRDAIDRVASVLQRNYAGFASGRPIGSFLFLGPTGVGKTEFARALAEVLFADRDALVRVDMSEYMEAHSVARLIGAPPGYVGHDAGGMLTEPIRRSPYQLVLLDEVEKAHPDVLNVLIQVLDEGHLTDSRGRTVDFTQTVVVMTSNLGADELSSSGTASRAVGFARADDPRNQAGARLDQALTAARRHFRPELWNRIDEPIPFLPLDRDAIETIARRLLAASSSRLQRERRLTFTCTDAVVDYLIENGGYVPDLGARPMRRTVEKLIEGRIANEILSGNTTSGCTIELDVVDGTLDVRITAPDDGQAGSDG